MSRQTSSAAQMARRPKGGGTALVQGGGNLLGSLGPQAEVPEGAYALSRWQQILSRDAVRAADKSAPKPEEAILHEKRPGGARLEPEVFGRLYGDPAKVEQPRAEHRWMARVHAALDQIPDFEALRQRCQGDEAWSMMAMRNLFTAACKACPPPNPAEKKAAKARELVEGLGGAAAMGFPTDENAIAQAEAELAQAEAELEEQAGEEDQSALRHELRSAISSAVDDIDATADALAAFGGTGGHGAAGQQADERDPKKRMALAQRIQRDPNLKAILEEAGRLRRVLSAKRAQRASHAPEELCNIELGGDLGRLLPVELMRLVDPLLELDAYRRISERAALQYQLKGVESKSRGPVVVCVDESGSMSGSRNTWAKGLALAILDLASKEKRGFALISFDSRVSSTYYCPPGKAQDLDKLIHSVMTFSGGGTDFQAPLNAARKIVDGEHESMKLTDADIILVTDGECSVEPGWLKKWNQWREESDCTIYAFPIGCAVYTLDALADTIVKLDHIGKGKDDGVMDVLASI